MNSGTKMKGSLSPILREGRGVKSYSHAEANIWIIKILKFVGLIKLMSTWKQPFWIHLGCRFSEEVNVHITAWRFQWRQKRKKNVNRAWNVANQCCSKEKCLLQFWQWSWRWSTTGRFCTFYIQTEVKAVVYEKYNTNISEMRVFLMSYFGVFV